VRKEVALYKKLSHTGVVYLYETFPSRNGLTLVLEHLPAGTLCSHLRKQKTLTVNRQPVLLEPAAAALLLPIAQVQNKTHSTHS
jgi:serine/threonine protein kinase